MPSIKTENIRMDMIEGSWENFLNFAKDQFLKEKDRKNLIIKNVIGIDDSKSDFINEGEEICYFRVESFSSPAASDKDAVAEVNCFSLETYKDITQHLEIKRQIKLYQEKYEKWDFARRPRRIKIFHSMDLFKPCKSHTYNYKSHVFSFEKIEGKMAIICHLKIE